ncbi:DUF2624 family protein [Bacillus sp. HMF5848]|uniref:DUF2624 family protein n=1 Tax=Bacillus sp. HMF5848 TaxID=2495421 RepID=UPI000F7B7B3F|nr:DUF2624 family protein [Bacillus sp. HMF5848]RSK27867.1 DUF2624 family protein [Bacillus sp. HMF5848]
MNVLHQMVIQKIKATTPEELITYAKQYDITLSMQQAKKVVKLIKQTNPEDIYDNTKRRKLLKKIAVITNIKVAKQLNEMFNKYLK